MLRHCERSEAIHRAANKVWIASSQALLAMTRRDDRVSITVARVERSVTREISRLRESRIALRSIRATTNGYCLSLRCLGLQRADRCSMPALLVLAPVGIPEPH